MAAERKGTKRSTVTVISGSTTDTGNPKAELGGGTKQVWWQKKPKRTELRISQLCKWNHWRIY